jgi:hypothetical protein
MLTVIHSSQSISQTFLYNENKVQKGVAECIGAANYLMDPEKMTPENKLNRLLNLVALNENVKRHCIHISINFSPSERLSNARMVRIADTFMGKLRFGEQPYLIYRHHDAGHPHLHIVTVNVGPDGKRISMFRHNQSLSETACKETEQAFGLVSAGARHQKQTSTGLRAQKASYGNMPSKMAIAGVLDRVVPEYKYTSLEQFNTVLAAYNVTASRGGENSKTYQGGGLVYQMLDGEGRRMGVPIKASDFDCKPTLKLLEKKFQANKINREHDKTSLKNTVDLIFLKQPVDSVAALSNALEKEGIHMVLRKNTDGSLADITYVDFRRKSVFNEGVLGTPYQARGIEERCSRQLSEVQKVMLGANWRLRKRTAQDHTRYPPLTLDPNDNTPPASNGMNKALKAELKSGYSHYRQQGPPNIAEKQKATKRGFHL